MGCLKLTYYQTYSNRKVLYSDCVLEPKSAQMWLSVDPMSDKYPSMSPYNYCANNPVILVDPDGRDIYSILEDGSIILYKETESTTDYYCWGEIQLNDDGKITNKYVEISKNKATDKTVTMTEGVVTTSSGKDLPYNRYDFNNPNDATAIYNFIIDNDKQNGKTGAKNEWSLNIMSENGKDFGIITSGGLPRHEPGATAVFDWFKENQNTKGLVWKSNNHNHPSGSDRSRSDENYAAKARALQTNPIKFTLNPNKQNGEITQKKISY